MGTLYYVGCRTCNIWRNLDNFYGAVPVKDRKDALRLNEAWGRGDKFRSVLLASFMAEHSGCNCTFFSEHDDEIEAEFNKAPDDWPPANLEDRKFWHVGDDES